MRSADAPAAAPRAIVRDLFLRLLGAVFAGAFLALFAQVAFLFGRRGLLPAGEYLDAARAALGSGAFWAVPSVFWLSAGDTALRGVALAGAAVGAALAFGFAPRLCLALLWALYLSFASIGQDFLSFQWDNLLLESAFFAMFVAPAGWRPRGAPPPHRAGVFLMLWLVFRLHVESGAAKLLGGDPTWRDLTAMATYYETAPLPTWAAWYAHQLPLWVHKLCSLFTYVVELGAPLLLWAPPRARLAAFLAMAAMQVSIILTANYGFFNYLTLALLLFALDDDQIPSTARSVLLGGDRLVERGRPAAPRALVVVAAALVLVSVVPFAPWLRLPDEIDAALAPAHRVLRTARSINAYHLFASMTLVRREVVIEGSDDGERWEPYELRFKPGDPQRAPAFVAPYQPRVDFQLWFLALRGGRGERYFDNLLARVLAEPRAVASLFARDPFGGRAPRCLRVALYRYGFTDAPTRRATGAWWRRDLEGTSRVVTREAVTR
jgi:uncharacterized membrane protein YphA (DoxX/SURF4 family)